MPAKKAQKPKKPKTYLAPTADKVIRQPSDGVIERSNARVQATYNGFRTDWKDEPPIKMPKATVIHTDPKDHDYPVGATCGVCDKEFSIDPVEEENLVTVKHSKYGYCLTTKCPHCDHVEPPEPTNFSRNFPKPTDESH